MANYSNFSGIESDMIGFVMNTYFLSTSFNPHDISTPFFPGIDMIPQVKMIIVNIEKIGTLKNLIKSNLEKYGDVIHQ